MLCGRPHWGAFKEKINYPLSSLRIVSVTAEINFDSKMCLENSGEFGVSVLLVSNRVLYSTPKAKANFSTISSDGVLFPTSIWVIYGADTPVFSANASWLQPSFFRKDFIFSLITVSIGISFI